MECAGCGEVLTVYYEVEGQKYCPICAIRRAEDILDERIESGEDMTDEQYEEETQDLVGYPMYMPDEEDIKNWDIDVDIEDSIIERYFGR